MCYPYLAGVPETGYVKASQRRIIAILIDYICRISHRTAAAHQSAVCMAHSRPLSNDTCAVSAANSLLTKAGG